MMRWVIYIFSLYLLVGVLLDTEPVRGWMKEKIITLAKEEYNLQLSFDEFRLYPTFRASFKNVRIEQVEIENLFISFNPFSFLQKKIDLYDIKIIRNSFPQAIQGSLLYNLTTEELLATFQYEEYTGRLSFHQGKGNLYVEDRSHHLMSLGFMIDEERISISDFRGLWDPFSIEGQCALRLDGTIEQSSFKLYSPHFYALSGKGSIKGPLFSPEIDASIECPFLDVYGLHIDNPFLSYMNGSIFLSFNKDGEPYKFNGFMQGISALQMRFDLKDLARIMDLDQAHLEGDLFCSLDLKKQELSLKVSQGAFENYDLGFSFNSISALLEGNLNSLTLKNLSAQDVKGGMYQATGTVDLKEDFPFTLDLAIQEGELFHKDIFTGIFNGTLKLTGNKNEGLLKGSLKAVSAKLKIPEHKSNRSEIIDVTYINLQDGEPEPLQYNRKNESWPLSLDVKLNLPEPGELVGKNFTSEWKGKVAFTGTASKPKAKGEFKLKSGKYRFRGRQVKIKEGRILLAGDPLKQTTLYITAEQEFGAVNVNAVLKGPVLNPSITLSSTPALSQRSLLSLMLFNKPVSDINPMEETELTRSIRELAEQSDDKPDILTRMGSILGLDRVEIGSLEKGDVTLKVGKYLTEDTFISISSSLSQDDNGSDRSNCVSIEKQFGKHVRFRAEADSEANGRVNLLWRNDY